MALEAISMEPPGAKATSIVIGLSGYSALAFRGKRHASIRAKIAAALKNRSDFRPVFTVLLELVFSLFHAYLTRGRVIVKRVFDRY
jgi:hypothetical protein